MKPIVEPINATLGAVVTDVDLSRLDDNTWKEIESAFHQYALLVFPGQHLSDEAQVAFGSRFGKIERLIADRKIVPISNQRADGTLLKDDEHGMQVMRGNEGWHTDSSYMQLAAKASVFSAHLVPSEGGQTEWADMRAAFDGLDKSTKEKIAGLCAHHSLRYSQARIGHLGKTDASYGFHDEEPPLRPLVKVHPVTGLSSLFIGRHAYDIPGLDADESEKLLDDLMEFACQPPRTYMHDWNPGDIVAWDNRCLLHRARPFDHSEARVMKHTRISGDPATESALPAQPSHS